MDPESHCVPRVFVAVLITLSAVTTGCSGCIKIPLNTGWTLSTVYENIRITNQSLPIGTYSALEMAGLVGSVYESFNDVNLRWIARRNWTFETQFATPEFAADSQVVLTFDGIDTVSSVRLNNRLLGGTNNMFVRYRFDVKELLHTDGQMNALWIEIQNPIKVASDLARMHSNTPPQCPPAVYKGECHMNFLRKMQASFAWDWGLAAPSSGIWKDVQLEVFHQATIRDVTVAMHLNGGQWQLRFRVYLEAGVRAASRVTGDLEIVLPGVNNTPRTTRTVDEATNGDGELVVELEMAVPEKDVDLWWPNGFGEQVLYAVDISFHAPAAALNMQTDAKSIRIGFRTINLIQEALGAGLSFYFEVNGHAMFMKGSNWIPADILPERGASDKKRIRYLLSAAKEAHMNMLRVWGGGVYESDYFYELADEFGILIWQDLMFACAMYPVHDEFLASVRTEVVQNTRRLQHHPSVAIFAANNENEAALVQNWYGTRKEFARFQREYLQLYIDVILKAVQENDPWRICLSSSPSNGLKAIEDGYVSQNPQDEHYGDVHYYNYAADGWNWSIYPRPRFASEYGFQSYPALSSWAQAIGGNDYLPDLMVHRQHSPLRDVPIQRMIEKHLPVENVPGDQKEAVMIYFSQVSQAMIVKAETELYRTLRGTFAYTMGALYWQLNDVWVAPSWSSIDFRGTFKILQYFAKKFLQPTSVVPIVDPANVLDVYLVNDQLGTDTTNYTVTMRLFNWRELQSEILEKWNIEMSPNTAQEIASVPLCRYLNESVPPAEHFLQFTLTDDEEHVVATNFLFPTPIKEVRGVANDYQPEVTVSDGVCDAAEGRETVTLSVRTEVPLLFFYVDILNEGIQEYQLSDNGFMIVEPISRITITYANRGCVGTRLTAADIKWYTVNEYMDSRRW